MLCIAGPRENGIKKKKTKRKISKRIISSKTNYSWDSDFPGTVPICSTWQKSIQLQTDGWAWIFVSYSPQ